MGRQMARVPAALFLICAMSGAAHAGASELIVSAGVSLTNAFNAIGKEFEKAWPGTRVIFNFGASDVLLQQIVKGAPVDVFASADQEIMDKAQSQNQIAPKTRINFARNRLVVVAPAGRSVPLKSLDDLTAPAIKRIAISQPATVPAGRYAREVLQAAGLWSPLEAKFIYTQNVRQSLDYVNRGEVDAGFVYLTDAEIMREKVKIAFEVPVKTPILYPIAVVKDSRNKDLAWQFVSFVTSAPGQKILEQYGFAKP